ncbi:hypothetical protein CVIRNUC_005546 [Coccomyxa viridis]|uniref:Ubiquitin-like domain-containing protein n=1 Tax=Coccomyxa viridis TaxID=1274662 RepID=A0AAV1I801_9CHLO|nr:hypothetical protein CVIRNUC_005546 [Coccomyxa viridis]
MFGQNIVMQKKPINCAISVKADGSDSIQDIKIKIAETFGGTLKKEDISIYFGPNERRIGKQFLGDPSVEEAVLKLKDFSVLGWLERFPHWCLSIKLMPAAPPAPGVATFKAAAMAEGKDPDQAVNEARQKGEIPALSELPSPWGPKAYEPTEGDKLLGPAKFPTAFNPLSDTPMVA